jgi:hypothetical protein
VESTRTGWQPLLRGATPRSLSRLYSTPKTLPAVLGRIKEKERTYIHDESFATPEREEWIHEMCCFQVLLGEQHGGQVDMV